MDASTDCISVGEQVHEATERDLGVGHAWALRRELERLKADLQDAECLRVLDIAGAPVAGGLLAITDRRLIYLRKRVGLPIMKRLEAPLSAIEDVRVEKSITNVMTVTVVAGGSRRIQLNLKRSLNYERVIQALQPSR